MSRRDEPVEYTTIDCDVVYASARAILIRDAEGVEKWVPRSVIENQDEWIDGDRDDEDVSIEVAVWFAKKEGLI